MFLEKQNFFLGIILMCPRIFERPLIYNDFYLDNVYIPNLILISIKIVHSKFQVLVY